ncbi:MAG: hypothetical protein DHS20C12_11870 [Pseudohongiella sp.]|nr:MAG: hypothetical protein DHS20C12_11870 [Pseudohongiella sp.]
MTELSQTEQTELLDLVDEKQNQRNKELGARASDVPMLLLPYQAKWHEDKSPTRILEKSRRIGGTWGTLAAEAALEAAEANGMDQYYIGYNKEMAAEFIGDCAYWAKIYQLAASKISVSLGKSVIDNEDKDIITYKIKFNSGYTITALSSKPSSLRGHQGHARIDEAAFHENLQEVIDAAMAFLIWGGRVDVVSTHFGDQNVFNQLVQDARAGKNKFSVHKVTFDDAIRDGFYKRICLMQGKTWSPEAEAKFRADIYDQYGAAAAQELDCIPESGSGVYMPRSILTQCQKKDVPIIHFERPPEWVTDDDRLTETQEWLADTVKPVMDNMPMNRRTVFGQDFGRDGDLSVIWILQSFSETIWETPFMIELRKIPFDVQKLIMLYVLDHLPHFHHAKFDARGNGQSHAEAALQKYPGKVECVMATQSWYGEYFPKYKSAYEDKSIRIPESEDIITDHRRVVLDKGRPKMSDGRDKGSDGKFRHGDSAVAGLLAWAAALEETEPAAGANVEESDEDNPYTSQRMSNRIRTTMFRR